MSYSIISWYGSLYDKDCKNLDKVVKSAKKMKVETRSLKEMYEEACMKMVGKIMSD